MHFTQDSAMVSILLGLLVRLQKWHANNRVFYEFQRVGCVIYVWYRAMEEMSATLPTLIINIRKNVFMV